MKKKEEMFLKLIQDIKESNNNIDIEVYNKIEDSLFYITKQDNYSTILSIILGEN